MKVIHTELKVNLPNHEYTKVGIKPGLSIADALSKAMKKRNLDTKTYEAIMVSDPEKVSNFSVQKKLICMTIMCSNAQCFGKPLFFPVPVLTNFWSDFCSFSFFRENATD